MAQHTRHRRILAFPDPQTPPPMYPSQKDPSRHHRPPPPPPPVHLLPDPTLTPPSTVQAISHRFSKLYANHKQNLVSDTHCTALTKSSSHRDQSGNTQKSAKKDLHMSTNPKANGKDWSKNRPCSFDAKRGVQQVSESDRRTIIVQPVPSTRERRRSFCSSEVELADFLSRNGVKVAAVDMPPLMQIHAVDCARNALDGSDKFTSKTLAFTLKKEFDGAYGPAWHCIVGKSFGSFVTHSVGGFMYFCMDHKLYVLLFKTAVQRVE